MRCAALAGFRLNKWSADAKVERLRSWLHATAVRRAAADEEFTISVMTKPALR